MKWLNKICPICDEEVTAGPVKRQIKKGNPPIEIYQRWHISCWEIAHDVKRRTIEVAQKIGKESK